MTPGERGLPRKDLALLALLMALGLALRVYRLSGQSFWIEDFMAMTSMGAPDLKTFLTLMHFISPDNTPLFWPLMFFWKCVAGSTPIAMRAIGLIPSIMCVPILYILGKAVFGRKAGLIAALCFALSPIHIWIAQAPRPNALCECLALVSLYALLRVTSGGSWIWWTANCATNLTMIWAYPPTAFLIAAEWCPMGLLLLRRWRPALLWMAVHVIILASPWLWLAPTLHQAPQVKDDFCMVMPSAKDVLIDLVGDDAVMSSDPFSFQGQTWPWLSDSVSRAVVGAHVQFDQAIMIFFGVCLLWGFLRVGRALWRERFQFLSAVSREDNSREILLLSVVVVPLMALLVLSFLWRPGILPRYTSYCSLALYIVAGGAIAHLSKSKDRKAAVVALVILYAYQLSVALPATTRTNWRGAHRHIMAQATPNDIILVKGVYLDWEVYRFNNGETDLPLLPAYTLEAICDKSTRFLESDAAAPRNVWAVIAPFIYTLPPLSRFEETLTARGLTFARADFPGMNGVFVYRIERDPAAPRKPIPETLATGVDYEGILKDMGIRPEAGAAYTTALAALRACIDTEFPRTPYYYSQLTMKLCNEGYLDLAIAAGQRAVTLDPQYVLGRFMLAVALGEKGDRTAAASTFQEAMRADITGFMPHYEALFRALYEEPDPSAARTLFQRMDPWCMFLPQSMRVRAGLLTLPRPLTNSL